MGSGLIVKQNERVTSYNPDMEVYHRGTQPFKTVVVQFQVSVGKYSVIPLVMNQRNPLERYSLRMYFNTEPDKVKFHSNEPAIRILDFIQGRGNVRNPLFQADEKSMVQVATNLVAKKIMVPYTLDTFLNEKANKAKKTSGVTTTEQTIAKNKKDFEKMNVYYEDNAKGGASSLAKVGNPDVMLTRE